MYVHVQNTRNRGELGPVLVKILVVSATKEMTIIHLPDVHSITEYCNNGDVALPLYITTA